jgi:hypothetical protein
MNPPPFDPVRILTKRCAHLESELEQARLALARHASVIPHLLDHIPSGTVITIPTQEQADILRTTMALKGIGWWITHPNALEVKIGPPT